MIEYFKFRDPFDKSPHKYEIGNPIKFDRKKGDNFFFKKFFSLEFGEYAEYYQFHLGWFVSYNNLNTEKEFFTHVLDKIEDQIAHYHKKNITALDTIKSLEALRKFKDILVRFDKWHIKKSLEIVVSEQDIEILRLKQEILLLKGQIKSLNRYESDQKIRLLDGNLPQLIDLIKQIQNLQTPDGKKLASSQSQSPWYKMIARYFQHGESEISLETLRNYFPANKTGKLIKGSDVSESNKLFKIIPVNPKP
ncbi:hypothetical protein EZ449_04885 [Pedobacter frigidisoli]|uniref:Uncharacterized protein n=1 Tax=Pedobacter frigidisoli TaxID=2530455 RepID=A0A4R0P4Q9_9SPHI|nr:hypothetical protein [Pedobacter frigidisoli]TCD11599.1 hypothetical protein EZ449_04885 [Pedobacter frigidisoli]